MRVYLRGLIAAAFVVALVSADPALAQGTYSAPSSGPRTQDRGRTSSDEKKAQEILAQLIAQAKADVASHRYAEATKAADKAVEVSEQLYGARDPRLVDALSSVVYTRMSWDSYAAATGAKPPSGLGNAVKAQERIAKIYGDSDADPKARVAALVDLGDVYLYANDERAIQTYRNAWQLESQLASSEAADSLFASVGVVRLALPPNPSGHAEWMETVKYDVGADGRIAVTDVAGPAPDSLSADIKAKYTDARFRPRLVGGEAVATTGLSSSHKYVAN